MKKYEYLVRDLDLLNDDTNEIERRLKEYGDEGFKLVVSERYITEAGTFFRCVFQKSFDRDVDKDEIGYEELFKK